jgi:predicted MFS family arabinose efflux permease
MKQSFWYPTLVGLFCVMIGLAFCRFSYTPMIPVLIKGGWLTDPQANYVGSFNFAGYFIGALTAHTLSKYIGKMSLARITLILACVTLFLCAWHLGFAWLSFWRFLAGIFGAFLIVLTPSIVMRLIAPEKRFVSSGIMFMGCGLGIVISGFGLPWLAHQFDLNAMWLGLAILCFIIVVFSWRLFANSVVQAEQDNVIETAFVRKKILCFLSLAYFVCGIAVVPHTLFLADYLHKNYHESVAVSGMLFSLFGAGCMLGSFAGGLLSARIGTYSSLILAYVVGVIAILLVLLSHSSSVVAISAFVVGIYLFATVNLASLRVGEAVNKTAHARYWGKVTLCFALGHEPCEWK